MQNTALHLQYRDGSNFKFHMTVVLPGRMPTDFQARLERHMENFDGEPQFNPTAVGLPAPFPWLEGAHLAPTRHGVPYERDDDNDHDFCTLEVEPTDDAATSGMPSPLDVLTRIATAAAKRRTVGV